LVYIIGSLFSSGKCSKGGPKYLAVKVQGFFKLKILISDTKFINKLNAVALSNKYGNSMVCINITGPLNGQNVTLVNVTFIGTFAKKHFNGLMEVFYQ